MLNECVRYTVGMYELFIGTNMKIVYCQILIRKKFISILYIYIIMIRLRRVRRSSFVYGENVNYIKLIKYRRRAYDMIVLYIFQTC